MIHSPLSSPQDKSFLSLWNKNFLTEIYRSIQPLDFQVLGECGFWVFGAMQIFFLAHTRNMFAGKLIKCYRSIFFYNNEWVEVRQMGEVFGAKLHCKMSDFFCQFSLVLCLSLKKFDLGKIQLWGFEPCIFWSTFRDSFQSFYSA